MPPGYRRRILIEPVPGAVTAELEDDYHRMVVTVHHAEGVATRIESAMKRAPWTMCPGAMQALADTFTGVPLAGFPRRGERPNNCTHLHDLAVFAAAHADEAAPVAYDILVSDPLDGRVEASLVSDTGIVMRWSFEGGRIVAPAELSGRAAGELGDWIATLDRRHQEAARILRWASIVALGRGMDIPAGIAATAFPLGTCFNFHADRAARSTRLPGADIDFSAPGREPLADRSRSFALLAGATP